MIARTTNPDDIGYHRYGGRGISVCDKWLQSFENFLADMGPKPSSKHSVDRVNPDGDYESNNCRWATQLEQNRNKRNNRRLTFKGETKCLTGWAEVYGLKPMTLTQRLERGWSVEDALTIPVVSNRKPLITPSP